ncbi:NAD dependent epimerase/dehydratase [Paraphoma chrysanthemicola]|uniref:NAD dependent epimerase/dehydratase n=1 Tax=Paraphoma chrysanthemicola TaxID=798071 RepID=A0A8K0W078_9PLEO|nr:NAD dependent epimerase/dehydratase [Paraphoma chrysanthemicola]
MGQEPSLPRQGTQIKVIGAGLPRTGTTSLALALAILLDGPVYDGGMQLWHGKPGDCTDLIDVLRKTPIKSSADKASILKTLNKIMEGYIATTDTPGAQFVPELLELYPDAMVICTVRDPDEWAHSIRQIVRASVTRSFLLSLILLPLPGLRHFTSYTSALRNGRWGELYIRPGEGTSGASPLAWYERQIVWLKNVVPTKQLRFYDIRDGWEPLCKALDVPVPVGVEFPKLNDAKSADEFAKRVIRRGLLAWAAILGMCALVAIYLTLLFR